MDFNWKPASEIPTEHWEKNSAISPRYLVKCNGTTYDGLPVIGYASYSFAVNRWMQCFNATEEGLWEVIAWSNIKL
jgi:hypothetical protein